MAMDLKWMLGADDKVTPVFDKVQASGKQMADGIGGAFGKLKSSFDGLTGLVGGLVGIAAGGAMAAVIKTTVDWDLSVAKLANTMGITLESASVFSVAMRTLGVDQDTATSAAMKLAKSVSTNPQVFKDLGVAVTDSSGHYRDSLSVMQDVNAKLAEQKGGLDRNSIAMQIYGKSWSEVQPLLKITKDAMDEAAVTAERLHLIVGPEGVKQSKEYKKSLNELGLVSTSLAVQFGNVLLPKIVAVGSYLGEHGPLLGESFGYLLTFVQKTFTTIGEWVGLMAFRFYSLGAIIWDAFHLNFAAVKLDFAAMVDAGTDFSKKTAENWTSGWKAPKQALQDVKGTQDLVTTATADYSKQLKEVVSQFDKYAESIKNVGKEELALAKDGLTEDLARQQTLLKENGQIWSDMQTPVKSYIAVVDNVAATQLKMISDTRSSINALINSPMAATSIGGKDSTATFGGDLKKTLEKLKLDELEIEKQSLDEKYKAWESYYKSLKSLILDKDKEINAAHLELMNTRLEMDKASKTLNAPVVDDSFKDSVTKYYELIDSLKSRISGALELGDAEQAQKDIKDITAEIVALGNVKEGVFATEQQILTSGFSSFSGNIGNFSQRLADVNKTAAQESLSAWTTNLNSIQSKYDSAFNSMIAKQKELSSITMTTEDLFLQVLQKSMSPGALYNSKVSDLNNKENLAQSLTGDDRISLLQQVQQGWASLAGEVKDGDTVVVSLQQSSAQSLDKIRSIGTELKNLKTDQVVAAQNDFNNLSRQLSVAKNSVSFFQNQLNNCNIAAANMAQGLGQGLVDSLTTSKTEVVSFDQKLSDLNEVMGAASTAAETLGQQKIKSLATEMTSLQAEMVTAKTNIDEVRISLTTLDAQITQQKRVVTMSLEDYATAGLKNIKSALDDLVSRRYSISVGVADNYSGSANRGGTTVTTSGLSPALQEWWNNTTNSMGMPSYDVGTPYVPRDQIAKVHKGERIVTAADNANGSYGGITIQGGISVVVQGGNTAPETVDQIARKLLPKLDELARRRRTA